MLGKLWQLMSVLILLPEQISYSLLVLEELPFAINAIDCTHVAIVVIGQNEAAFVSRKQFHALRIHVICDDFSQCDCSMAWFKT